jgi:hypothetical protein
VSFPYEALIIVSNRLGLKSIPPEYFPTIKYFMKLPQFVGLLGGKPGYAYYICGTVEEEYK